MHQILKIISQYDAKHIMTLPIKNNNVSFECLYVHYTSDNVCHDLWNGQCSIYIKQRYIWLLLFEFLLLYNVNYRNLIPSIFKVSSILVLRSVCLTPIDFTSFFAKNGTNFHSHRIRSFSHFYALRHYLANPFPVNKTHKLQHTVLKQ